MSTTALPASVSEAGDGGVLFQRPTSHDTPHSYDQAIIARGKRIAAAQLADLSDDILEALGYSRQQVAELRSTQRAPLFWF